MRWRSVLSMCSVLDQVELLGVYVLVVEYHEMGEPWRPGPNYYCLTLQVIWSTQFGVYCNNPQAPPFNCWYSYSIGCKVYLYMWWCISHNSQFTSMYHMVCSHKISTLSIGNRWTHNLLYSSQFTGDGDKYGDTVALAIDVPSKRVSIYILWIEIKLWRFCTIV